MVWPRAPGGKQVWYWDRVQLERFDGIFTRRPGYLSYRYFGFSSMTEFGAEYAREQPNVSQFYDSGGLQLLERVGEPGPGR